MKISDLINEIITEWSYRVENGMPDVTNPMHIVHLGIVLKEMGLSHIKQPLIENLLMEKGKTPDTNVAEADGNFTNPILNKSIKYKNAKGEDSEGLVGNLLRLPAEHPGRVAAEKMLPADGSPERDALNKDLGGQNQPKGAEKPKDGEGEKAGGGEEEKAKAAQAMFDPKADPAMGARMDKEKEVQAQLAKDAQKAQDDFKAQADKAQADFKAQSDKAQADFKAQVGDKPEKAKAKGYDFYKLSLDDNELKAEEDKERKAVADAKANGDEKGAAANALKYYQTRIARAKKEKDTEAEQMWSDEYISKRADYEKQYGKPEDEFDLTKFDKSKSNETEFTPIDTKDVAKEMPQADPETFNGDSDIPDKIEPAQLEKFNTDISKVAQQVADAKAKGEPAPNINLCDVTVPGTNLYCDDNLGIPRDEMPQFKGNASPGSRAAGMDKDESGEVDTEPVFKEMLKEKGIKTLQTEVPADKLKATQKDLVGAKVVGMMSALEKDPQHPKITAPIYVSRDGHVIDGHHRWAAIVAHNAANPDKQIPMKTTVLDMDIKDAIPMANKFAEDMGIAAKKADANKETPSEPQKVTSAPKITEKIKKKIENWTEKEKAFFDRNEGAPGSKERRSLGQALKDKAAGALKAIKKGFKHEVEEFKAAGSGVKNFFSGKELSEHEVKAVKAVAFKVVTTAVFGAAFGGLSHGVAAFGKHVAMEFIPHVIGETILKGAGKAAVFADMEGEAEMDANMVKFAEMIADGLENMEISPEMMEDMVDSYNQKKESGELDASEEPNVKEEHLHLVDELMLEMIYGFINEIKPKSKQFQAISKKSGKVSDFDSEEARDAAVKKGTHTDVDSKDKSDTQPAQTGSMYDDPEYQKRRAAETPPTTKKKKGKKNKQLDQTKNTKKEFNKGDLSKDGVTDEEFAANKKVKPAPNQIKVEQIEKFFLDKNGNTKFPKKYLKVLARLLSTKPGGVTISDFTDVSGAGTLSSTMGELLTLMAVTIKDDNEAKEFFNMIRQHVKANGSDSIIDIGWVNSAEKVRKTQFARYDRKYGKGNWELDNMAWDIEGEVEALGMENYKENKGFSTDVYAKVKVNGEYLLDEISLKKEIKANLLNATSGRVADIMVRGLASDEDLKIYDDLNTKIDALSGLKDKESVAERKKLIEQRDAIVEKYNVNVPDDVKVSKVQKVQRELHEKFVEKGVGEISEFLKKFCDKTKPKSKEFRKNAVNVMTTTLNQKPDYNAKVTQQLDALCPLMPKGGFKTAEDYNNALKQAKIGDTSDMQKINMAFMAAIGEENPKSQAAKSYKLIVKNSHNHSKAVREFLLTNPAAKKGLLMSIREALPLKALFEGEENMILSDVSIDDDVLKDVFGVDSFEELEQKLTVRDTPPPPSIVYRVAGPDGSNTDIPVAEIVSRPDGIGYGGSWKLIMAVHPDFAKKLKEANERLNAQVS